MTSAYYFCADAIGFSAFWGGKLRLTSLAPYFCSVWLRRHLCSRIGLPRIIGMLLVGILIARMC